MRTASNWTKKGSPTLRVILSVRAQSAILFRVVEAFPSDGIVKNFSKCIPATLQRAPVLPLLF